MLDAALLLGSLGLLFVWLRAIQTQMTARAKERKGSPGHFRA